MAPVALPLLVQKHTAHDLVPEWAHGRTLHLAGHALVETFSVLTRLPTGLRASPVDAARLLTARFAGPLLLSEQTALQLPDLLASLDIATAASRARQRLSRRVGGRAQRVSMMRREGRSCSWAAVRFNRAQARW